jgi:hypothetical protein
MSDYNGSIIRAIRGPVILITIGGLFALNNLPATALTRPGR